MSAEARDGGSTVTALRRGIQEPLHPFALGSIIGAAGATAFVNINRVSLPGHWPQVAFAAWLVALAGYLWAVFLRRRELGGPGRPDRLAGLVYVGAILGMLVVIAAGRAILSSLGREELEPAVVVLAVGLHFIPFAGAFHAPVFAALGVSLAVMGLVGLVLGAVLGGTAVAVTAVLTGLVMLVLMALDAGRA